MLIDALKRPELAFIQEIAVRFPQAQVYLVGGAVRDAMLGRETKDLDFVVRGVPGETLERALAKLGSVNYVGKTFGVYKFVPRGGDPQEPFDVALPRTEHSDALSGAYREFSVQSDPGLPVEDDLGRRDYTVNAMALNVLTEELVDPFNGKGDLCARRLRAVGEPDRRFAEDYSRMLRGLRLACQLGFDWDADTWASIVRLMPRINATRGKDFIVPRETVGRELVRAFVADPVKALDLWDASGAISEIMPELLPMKGCPQPPNYHAEGDVWTHTRLALERATSPEFTAEWPDRRLDAEVVFAVLLHDVAKPVTITTPEKDGTDRIRFNNHDNVGARMARAICERLKLSQFPRESPWHIDSERLGWLVAHHLLLVHGPVADMKNSTIEKYFFADPQAGEQLLMVMWADGSATVPPSGTPDLTNYRAMRGRIAKLAELGRARKGLPPPLVDGRRIMAEFGVPAGPVVGKYLALVREAQLAGQVATADDAVAWLKRQIGTAVSDG
ncbi:MAG: CCA tRNA nucleotidyltransferase [Nitrospirota bacterium]